MNQDNLPRKTANFRECPNGQCELEFNLKKQFKFGVLEKNIVAKRQASDTVESLLNHIVNKIKKSIKDMQEDADVNVDISLTDRIGNKIIEPSISLTHLATTAMLLEFSIFEQRFLVVFNAPFVKEMQLPDLIYSNFIVSPVKFIVLFAERSKCQFSWYKSSDKKNWELLPVKQSKYKVLDDDIGCYLKLKCVPCNDTMTGVEMEVISENVVEKMRDIPRCPFEIRHKYTEQPTREKTFRLVSYNVLSERYTDTAQFPYCPPHMLASNYRKQLISKELLGYNADVICLQEVDLSLYNSYYKELLKSKGYMSFFHRKGEIMSEGLAIFFLASRFRKIADYQILFRDEIMMSERYKPLLDCLRSNKVVLADFSKQKTSMHVTVLKMEKNVIIIANTHLFYRPDAKLLRLIQMCIATSHLAARRKQFNYAGKVSVVVCGDFNSHPTSAVFQFMTEGKIERNHEVFKEAKMNTDITHPFGFESVYGTPKYTNYTGDFKGCLDYIFVQKARLSTKSVVPLFDDDVLEKYPGLPNEVFPSDHLALVSDLDIL